MKAAPVIRALERAGVAQAIIHSGQHYDAAMSDVFFRDLGLPVPDRNLGVGSGSHAVQTAAIMVALEQAFGELRPALAVVYGDVNSTTAAALVAAKIGLPLAHVEAGLRSFDRRMPEELNRILTDSISSFLFVTEPSGVRNLRAEGVADEKIHLVGNVMIDTLMRFREKAARSGILETLGVRPRAYAVVTLHRPSNVDDPAQLRKLHGALVEVSRLLPVVFPVHPRTKARLAEQSAEEAPGLKLIPPLGYLDFLRLMAEARLVLTDSGGIQEETTVLQVPCLTLRENTERPVTVEQGTNRLIGVDPAAIVDAAKQSLAAPAGAARIPEMWDGKAAGRILDVLEQALG
jgi:UDP-N-acetylglucosamine 2-epimerase (non-hydrolysing)